MRTLNRSLMILALGAGLTGAMSTEAGSMTVSVGGATHVALPAYYHDLAPYGAWTYVDASGWFWQPTVCDQVSGWKPYVHGGRWSRSGSGWRWVSNYGWGHIPFHYGSWLCTPTYGWAWFPGTEWAEAWVEWDMRGGDYGWAPCAPTLSSSAYVALGFSLSGGSVQVTQGYGPGSYLYVPSYSMTSYTLYSRCYTPGVSGYVSSGSGSVSFSYVSGPAVVCAPTTVYVPACPPPRVVCAPPVVYAPRPVYVAPPVVCAPRPPVAVPYYGVSGASVTVSSRQTSTSSAVNVKTRQSGGVTSPAPSRRGSAVRRVTQLARR